MKSPIRVVVVGGGYAAIYACRIWKHAIRSGLLDVTVVSRENYHVFHGLAAEVLTGKIQPSAVLSPCRRIMAPARFHNAEIEAIDLEARTVTAARSLDGKQYVLPYDHLVVSVGSTDDVDRIPGVAEHAWRLRSYADLFRTRNHILTMLELAELEGDPEERRRLLTFVVAGGNFAGVEVATELVDFFYQTAGREYPHISRQDVRVVIVHGGDHLLPEMRMHHPSLADYADSEVAELGARGLEVRLKTRLHAATTYEAILSTGERIPTRTIISCTGTSQSPLLDTLPFARDDRGRIIVDATLLVPGTTNVWSAGDCAAVPHPRGGTAPMLASYAMYGGRQLGKNILRVSRGRTPKPFAFAGIGDAVALGRRHAAAQLKDVARFTGFVSWLMWRAFMLYYLPSRDRKVRVLLDWLVWPIFGRDISSIQAAESGGVQRARYQPGQVIFREGDIGREVYVIQRGNVDIVQGTNGNEQVLVRLGPGDHFGERAVFEGVRRSATARATSDVRLLVLARNEALSLSLAVREFGDVLRELPTDNPDRAPTVANVQ